MGEGWFVFSSCFVFLKSSYQEPLYVTGDRSKIQPLTKKGSSRSELAPVLALKRTEGSLLSRCRQRGSDSSGASTTAADAPRMLPSKPKPAQDYSWLGRSNWYFMLLWKGFH